MIPVTFDERTVCVKDAARVVQLVAMLFGDGPTNEHNGQGLR